MSFNFEEEVADAYEWLGCYRETLTRWKEGGGRKAAQDAFHEWVMMGVRDPQQPVTHPLVLFDTPYWGSWYNGLLAGLLADFPDQARLLRAWANRDASAAPPIYTNPDVRKYNIDFLSSV